MSATQPVRGAMRRSPRPTASTRWVCSLSPIADAASLEADPGKDRAQFDANGYLYTVEHNGNRGDPPGNAQGIRRAASFPKVEADVAVHHRLRQAGILVPHRARRVPLSIADHMVRQGQNGGASPRATTQKVPVRATDPLGLFVLPREPVRASHERGQPLSDSDLSRSRHRLRSPPWARRAARGVPR